VPEELVTANEMSSDPRAQLNSTQLSSVELKCKCHAKNYLTTTLR